MNVPTFVRTSVLKSVLLSPCADSGPTLQRLLASCGARWPRRSLPARRAAPGAVGAERSAQSVGQPSTEATAEGRAAHVRHRDQAPLGAEDRPAAPAGGGDDVHLGAVVRPASAEPREPDRHADGRPARKLVEPAPEPPVVVRRHESPSLPGTVQSKEVP